MRRTMPSRRLVMLGAAVMLGGVAGTSARVAALAHLREAAMSPRGGGVGYYVGRIRFW